MSEDSQPAEQGFRVNFPGPFNHHDVVVNGWRVPFLEAHPNEEDRITLTLDRRLGVDLTTDEAERLLPFISDAIAVALGYGAHPRGEMPLPERRPHPSPRRSREIAAVRD